MLTDKYDDPTYLLESWILYAIGVAVILLRWMVRIRTVGFPGFQGDDYLSTLVLACFTSDAVAVHYIEKNGSNVDYTETEMRAMTDQERRWVAYGSKLQFVCWYTYPTLMWALKGCMMFFFNRLTLGLATQRVVKWMAYACGITYVIIILVTSLSCLPYHENWATLPYPRAICSTRFQDMYVVTILNVLTDAAMLSIPLPLLWRLQISLQRKLALGVMLMGGIFVIVAAIVRICMSLEAEPSTTNINRWGIRETIAGILAVNIPIIRPILRWSFWTNGALSASGPSQVDQSTGGTGKPRIGNPFARKSRDIFEMLDPTTAGTKKGGNNTVITACGDDGSSDKDVSDTSSEKMIINKGSYASKLPFSSMAERRQPLRLESRDLERGVSDYGEQNGGINVTTTYSVRPASPLSEHTGLPGMMSAGTSPPAPVELDGRVRDRI